MEFCNIGKAVLTKALGLQKNYSEMIETSYEVIDIEASNCESCKWHKIKSVTKPSEELYVECENACASCPHRCMKTEYTYKKVYHNEQNAFGYQVTLKTNAIKIFLLYHFLGVDSIGFIKNVDLQELADRIGCDIKTIHNNNVLLQNYGYIHFSKVDAHRINVYLSDYENYLKPASHGGRGFLVMSKDVLEEVLKITSINELRITLRELMEFDSLKNQKTDSIEKSYSELRRMLPAYCKRNIIQKASNKLSMFLTEIKDNFVKFIIKPEYDAKKQKEEQLTYYEQELASFSQEFAKDVAEINTNIYSIRDSKFADFFTEPETIEYRCWFFTKLEIADLASLCLQYSYDIVIKALQSIYKTYKLRGTPIKNLGGLTRTVINAMY